MLGRNAAPVQPELYRYGFRVRTPPRDGPKHGDDVAWERIEAATLKRRRQEFRETTPGQRLAEALELSRVAHELREGFLRANR